MNDIKKILQSPVFFGFLRAFVAAGCGWLASKGIAVGSYTEPITGGIVMLLVMYWSKQAKKPKRRGCLK